MIMFLLSFLFFQYSKNISINCGLTHYLECKEHPSNCTIFDELWGKPVYRYCVPTGSFCAGYDSGMFCWPVPDEEKELPHKVECEADIAPMIHYYFNEIDKCDVDTQYGIYKNNSGYGLSY